MTLLLLQYGSEICIPPDVLVKLRFPFRTPPRSSPVDDKEEGEPVLPADDLTVSALGRKWDETFGPVKARLLKARPYYYLNLIGRDPTRKESGAYCHAHIIAILTEYPMMSRCHTCTDRAVYNPRKGGTCSGVCRGQRHTCKGCISTSWIPSLRGSRSVRRDLRC